MNLTRLHEILSETTCQLRKGEAFEGTPELVEQAKRGEELKGGGVLEVYAMPHESEAGPNLEKVDVWFMTIGVHRAAAETYRDELIGLLLNYPNAKELADGPSYIAVGATLGDQGAAFQLFALGKVLGLWDVITPNGLGITDPELARQMAGAGYVLCTGYRPATQPEINLSVEDAIAMLPEGDCVHTFRNPVAGMMIGANWTRENMIKAITESDYRRLAGPEAKAMKHGLAINEDGRLLFVETRSS